MMNCIGNWIGENNIAVSSCILIVAYIFIASEKISKVTVALLGASVTIVLGLLSQSKVIGGKINPDYYINFVDFNVIFLLISMMIIVSITAGSGVFNYLANTMLKQTKGRPMRIIFALGLFTGLVSAFLDNVTTVILIMPITFAIADKLDINPTPFLITEIFASNIGGTATLIGDPPNIIIGSAANLSFTDFVVELSGVVVVILAVVLLLMMFIFRNDLKSTPAKMASVAKIDNTATIVNKGLMWRSLIVLGLVILGFIFKDYTNIETSIVALMGASVLLIFEKPSKILREVEWNTIFFFIGLFIIIGGLEASGGIKMMAQWIIEITRGSQTVTGVIILWASGIISGVIDNIPYTATMAPMIAEIEKSMGREYAFPLWWCLSLGACLGGNMTIIGAAANVIVSENAAKAGYKISFMQFFKYGILTVFISLTISTAYVFMRFFT